jgi:hypothetical protein
MARQTIAREWKLVQTLREGDQFVTRTLRLGRYTAATAAEKISARFPGYRYVPKPFSGFGGYWCDAVGNTVECLPL